MLLDSNLAGFSDAWSLLCATLFEFGEAFGCVEQQSVVVLLCTQLRKRFTRRKRAAIGRAADLFKVPACILETLSVCRVEHTKPGDPVKLVLQAVRISETVKLSH